MSDAVSEQTAEILIDKIEIRFDGAHLFSATDVADIRQVLSDIDAVIELRASFMMTALRSVPGAAVGATFLLGFPWHVAALLGVLKGGTIFRRRISPPFEETELRAGSIILKGERTKAALAFALGVMAEPIAQQSDIGKAAINSGVALVNTATRFVVADISKLLQPRGLTGDGEIDGRRIVLYIRRRDDDDLIREGN